MKKAFFIIFLMLALILTACSENEISTDLPENTPPDESISQPEASNREALPLTDENTSRYNKALWQLEQSGALLTTWEGEPNSESFSYAYYEIVGIEREEDHTFVAVKLYGHVFINPVTMEESLENDGYNMQVLKNGDHAIGESEVIFYEGEGSPKAISCTHTRYENPATAILKANTEAVKAELDASQKVVDVVENYDPYLLQALYRETLSNRWIESPEELTLYDLKKMNSLIINWESMGSYPDEMEDGTHYKMDAGLLRLTPNLQTLEIWPVLKDYSVFENMNDLLDLTIYLDAWYDPDGSLTPDISNLKIGKVANLVLANFTSDIVVDLTESDVRNLEVQSWVAGVKEFKGCENISKLRILNTRTDTSLINAENFLNAEYITLDFYSDYPRFRDLANLSTFADDVHIDIKLDYQAANNKTVESLEGVRINYLTLDPANGPYVLSEPSYELIGKINISPTNVIWLSNPAEEQTQTVQEDT